MRSLVLTWLALLALLALTVGSAYVPMGALNSVINLAIAAVKAALIAAVFMRLYEGGATAPRLVIAVAIGTLTLLVGLSGSDYATRGLAPSAWSAPGGK
jgi:cytochrome c oxidase subunit 4